MRTLGIIVAVAATLFLSCIWSGYVLCILWTWFLVPFGLPTMSVSQMVGIHLFWGVFKGQPHRHDERSKMDKFKETLGIAFLCPAFALFIGWIVTLFLP
jgi:hypothetical protein